MATADISWLEFGPPPQTASVSWLEFSPGLFTLTAEAGAYVLTGQDAALSLSAGAATASVSWMEFAAPGSLTVYTLNAEAGAYVMSWSGSTGQVVLEADPGAYVMEWPTTDLSLDVEGQIWPLLGSTGAAGAGIWPARPPQLSTATRGAK